MKFHREADWLARATVNQLLAGADLPWDLIVGRVKLYRKSHDLIGRYRMGLGEKTASRTGSACAMFRVKRVQLAFTEYARQIYNNI